MAGPKIIEKLLFRWYYFSSCFTSSNIRVKTVQDRHSISVASEIRRKLPVKLASQVKSLNVTLIGEQTEEDKGLVRVKVKGCIEVRGEADSVHTKGKIIPAIHENSGGRQVKDFLSVKIMR
jgi:hypothetical protein